MEADVSRSDRTGAGCLSDGGRTLKAIVVSLGGDRLHAVHYASGLTGGKWLRQAHECYGSIGRRNFDLDLTAAELAFADLALSGKFLRPRLARDWPGVTYQDDSAKPVLVLALIDMAGEIIVLRKSDDDTAANDGLTDVVGRLFDPTAVLRRTVETVASREL